MILFVCDADVRGNRPQRCLFRSSVGRPGFVKRESRIENVLRSGKISVHLDVHLPPGNAPVKPVGKGKSVLRIFVRLKPLHRYLHKLDVSIHEGCI